MALRVFKTEINEVLTSWYYGEVNLKLRFQVILYQGFDCELAVAYLLRTSFAFILSRPMGLILYL